jgi:hypothetical protein
VNWPNVGGARRIFSGIKGPNDGPDTHQKREGRANSNARFEGSNMNRKTVEEKARQIASGTFSDGTMRTMLYERIVDAFAERKVVTRAQMEQAEYHERSGKYGGST